MLSAAASMNESFNLRNFPSLLFPSLTLSGEALFDNS